MLCCSTNAIATIALCSTANFLLLLLLAQHQLPAFEQAAALMTQASATAVVRVALVLLACWLSGAMGDDVKQQATQLPKWLSTRGRHIIDGSTGERFKLRCASWSGAQEKWYVPSGLWAQHRSVIAGKVRPSQQFTNSFQGRGLQQLLVGQSIVLVTH